MDLRFRSARLRTAVISVVACAALTTIDARTAVAQDVTGAVEAPNLGVMGTHIEADDVRGVDDGQGIQFTMAWALSNATQLQLATSYTENSKSILAMAAASLRGQSGMRVEVAGHTDDCGGDSYNIELSRHRAQAVTEYLHALGIEPERMQAYGETQPMGTNSTDVGRERNRRVEFRVLSN